MTPRWNNGCGCAPCRRGHSERDRVRKARRVAAADAIDDGQPFRTALADFGLTSNQVWG
jgi:hypothetical protein